MSGTAYKALGLFCVDEKVFLFYRSLINNQASISINFSSDGVHFRSFEENIKIVDEKDNLEDITKVSSFKITKQGDIYYLTYLMDENSHQYLYLAKSNDLINWKKTGRLFPITQTGVLLPNHIDSQEHYLLFGGRELNLAYSDNLLNWNVDKNPIKNLKTDNNETTEYVASSATYLDKSTLFNFFVKNKNENSYTYSLWMVLVDTDDPHKIIYKPDQAVWHQPKEWIGKPVWPLGTVEINNKLISYWEWDLRGIFYIVHDLTDKQYLDIYSKLERSKNNPILVPRDKNHWENKQVFNPAAIYDNGKVHLFYRAIGNNETSVLGYAASKDGLNFTERSDKPAYVPREKFELPQNSENIEFHKPSPYESGGGGYGGIEDPRITKIDGVFYLIYVAYDGMNGPKIALSSINEKDFNKKNWSKWKKPVVISKPDVIDKNACILPEKINGKYVIFHRIYPNILIDFVDSLDFDEKSEPLKGEFKIYPRKDFWDSKKIGMGPPPIKTKDGWLAIYQSVGFQDPSKYKMGAMLLDLNDPTKVLYRSSKPILEPDEIYENEGFKQSVVYPCGAVVMDNTLIVYYGGSDSYVAAAVANLDEFLDQLKTDTDAHLDPVCIKSYA